jgi:hypothetical protein
LLAGGLAPVAEWLSDFMGRLNLGLRIFEMWLKLPEDGVIGWRHIQRAIEDTGGSSESTSYAVQALADAQDAAAAGADRHALALDMLNDAAVNADRAIAGMAANLVGTLGASGALSAQRQMNDELATQVRLWQDQGYHADQIANVLIPGWISEQRNVNREITRTSSAVSKVDKEYQSLLNKIQGVLSGALDPGVGVNPQDILEKMGFREDAINENARRLADIAQNGLMGQDWLGEFAKQVPQIWDNIRRAANPQEEAARLLQDFQDGLRPEIIDRGRAKDMVRRLLMGEQRMGDLAREIAAELAGEMGVSAGEALSAAQRALGTGDGGMGGGAGGDAASAFDSGMAQGLATANTGGNFVSQLATQMRASFRLIQNAGNDAGREFATGFATGSSGIPATFIQMLVNMVTPGVEAALNRRATQMGAVP